MHRTKVPHYLLCTLVAALAWSVGHATAGGQPKAPGAGTLVVPKDTVKIVQMSKQQIIKQIQVENPKIVNVTVSVDPKSVILKALEPGATRVTLIDVMKNEESFEVLVPQPGREEFIQLIKQAVPTANVDVVLGGGKAVLNGTVVNAESAEVITEVAAGMFGGPANVVNNMRIGGVQQVQLEVVVAVVNRSEVRNLAFSFLAEMNNNNNPLLTFGNILNTQNLAATATSFAATSTMPIRLVTNKFAFLGFLHALRNEGVAKVLSEPRITTLSGRPARIQSGGQVDIISSSGVSSASISAEFGTIVDFLPIVLGNGKIHLEVSPSLSQPTDSVPIPGLLTSPGLAAFAQLRRAAQATVVLEHGQTFMIGGLIQNSVDANVFKVPVLGDLPFVGTAFRNTTYTEREEEMIILVTPHLVDAMACTQIPKYLPGRETRIADDFELFLEGILEAPRGPRQICDGWRYKPAFLQDPTAGVYPCGDGKDGRRCLGRCGLRGGCNGAKCCGTTAPAHAATSSQESIQPTQGTGPRIFVQQGAADPAPESEAPMPAGNAVEGLPGLSPYTGPPQTQGRPGSAQDIRGLPDLQAPPAPVQGPQP